MKHLVFIFVFINLCKLNAQVMWQIKTNTFTKWYYQDGDEFNDFSVNEEKWQLGLPWSNLIIQQDLYFDRENIIEGDGKIALVAKKEKKSYSVNEWEVDKKKLAKSGKSVIDGKLEVNFTSGLITSKKQYKYGYFEFRFKANSEKGSWPAFWLYGGNPDEEVDFYEGKGERENQIHLDVHCQKGCDDYRGGFLNLKKNWGGWIKTKESLANDWNIISGEWQSNYVKFFLNGQAIGYFEGEFKNFKNLIINNSVANDNEAFNPGPDEKTKFPNSLLVDYVRIWSEEDTIKQTKDNYKLFESSINSITNNNLYNSEPKGKVNFIYNKKALDNERGTITLLPIFYNKYSLSFAGKSFGKVNVEVFDSLEKKVFSFNFENEEYYILDLSTLESGKYKLIIDVFNQKLIHDIVIKNPKR